jgi:hypothetical protein
MEKNPRVEGEVIVQAQAIPTFAIDCFDLTKTLCDQISWMICRYWWNNKSVHTHTHTHTHRDNDIP